MARKAPKTVRIALAQMSVNWKDPEGNIERAEALLQRAAEQGADLFALPEYFYLPARAY